MMPFDLRFRPAAAADLEDIARYILRVSASPTIARRYIDRIRERCRKIALLPRVGRPCDDLAPGLRTVAFERRAVIVYRIVNETVEVTNIFHGGRDYQALYQGLDDGADD